MFSLSGKTGIIVAAAAALVGAASWFIGMKYWRDDEEEIEEGVVYDKQGNKFSLEELKNIKLDKITDNCSGVNRQLKEEFMDVPINEIRAILGNEQLEDVFYAVGPFLHKHGGLPAVHKALEDYGDVVERTKWYASAVKAGINPYL
ncbi:uncharacterized protein LOC106669625 isoform X2 [Cimex lectularius]|uniref:Uncharacterized protein n=1 Tax=Cimex lectularius TaxID=79782 RepID=A0A8I6RYH1_CIMLE|nr:uncharacterized protein LOC106669625 isoform X2 [Cimex lectularius]